MPLKRSIILGAFVAGLSGAAWADSHEMPGDAAAGEKVFKKCAACHMVGDGAKNKVGPILTGIIDRPAGTFEGFQYSKALLAAADEGLVWDVETLTAYLASPRKFLKGTKMTFAGLKKDDDIANVIAYLATFPGAEAGAEEGAEEATN